MDKISKSNFTKNFKFFNPVNYGLSADFSLTGYASLKG